MSHSPLYRATKAATAWRNSSTSAHSFDFSCWAYTLKRIDEPTRAAYLAARARGQHAHPALRGVGARWARVLWRCWQDGVPFDPARRAAS